MGFSQYYPRRKWARWWCDLGRTASIARGSGVGVGSSEGERVLEAFWWWNDETASYLALGMRFAFQGYNLQPHSAFEGFEPH